MSLQVLKNVVILHADYYQGVVKVALTACK